MAGPFQHRPVVLAAMAHRIWRNVVIAAGATFTAFVVIVLMLLPTPWFKEQLRRVAVRQAAAYLNGDLTVSSLSGSLFSDVTLHGVSIRLDETPVVVVESIRARYDIVALIRGRMAIDELVLTRPSVRAIETADGWNVTRLVRARERTGGEPAAFTVRRVRVMDGQVTLLPLVASPCTFNVVSLDGAFELRGAAGTAEVGSLAVTDGLTGLTGDLRGDVRWDKDHVAVTDGHVRTAASALDVRVSYGSTPAAIDVAADIERLAVSDLARYVEVGLQRSVVLSGRVLAKGPLDRLAARWDISAGAATTRGDVTLGIGNAKIPVAGTVILASVDLGSLTGRRDLRSDVTATVRVDGALEMADLARSAGAFDIETGHVEAFDYEADRIDVGGRYDAGLLKLKGDVSAYGAKATMSLVASRLPSASSRRVRVSGRVQHLDLQRLPATLGAPVRATAITGDVTAATDGNRTRATIRFDDSRVGATAIAADSTASVDLVGNRLETFFDLKLENASSDLINRPGEWSASGHVDGRVLLRDRTEPLSASSAEFDLSADLDDLRARTAAAGRASLDMSLVDGLLTVRRLEVHDGVAALNATGVLAVADEASSPSDLIIEAGLDDLSWLSQFGVSNLTGVVGLTARVTGPADALAATGTLRSYGVGWNDAVSALTFGGDFELQPARSRPARHGRDDGCGGHVSACARAGHSADHARHQVSAARD